MRRLTKAILGTGCLSVIALTSSPSLAQMRGPRVTDVRDVTCVSNWERRFQMFSPGRWEMSMGQNDRNPFTFRETKRSTGSIFLESVHNNRLRAKLNLRRQRIKYMIPGLEDDPLFFDIASFNINGGQC